MRRGPWKRVWRTGDGLINHQLSSASMRPWSWSPHQQTGLRQRSSIKRDLLPNFKKGASQAEDMECHPPPGGQSGSPCIFRILLPFPGSWSPPCVQAAKAQASHRKQWHQATEVTPMLLAQPGHLSEQETEALVPGRM